MRETAVVAGLTGLDVDKKQFQIQARTRLFSPGQPIACELARNPTVLIVNQTMFAHGGVLPSHGMPSWLPPASLLAHSIELLSCPNDSALFVKPNCCSLMIF